MSFWGTSFVFDGVPSEEYDLMMYDVDGSSDNSASYASGVSIIEETVGRRWKPYFHGVKFDKKLEFDIVFGVCQNRIDEEKYLDRYEMAEVASWLTGHHEYKKLMIDQPDMGHVFYNCMITDLSVINYGSLPWALRAKVTCDSPYAYMPESVSEYEILGSAQIMFDNLSSINGYLYPVIEFQSDRSGILSITNISDDMYTFSISNIPDSVSQINVDCDRCIISNDQGLNLYENCNYKFLRLKRGMNILNIKGNGTLVIRCEFPIDIGG